MAQTHPAALQSGSLALQNHGYMPPQTRLVEDRVKALPSEPSAYSRTGYVNLRVSQHRP